MTQLNNMYNCWGKLTKQAEQWQTKRVDALFKEDSNRAARYTISAAGLTYDYSKNLIDAATMENLLSISEQADLEGKIKSLLNGEKVNQTEDRPALHTALRFCDKPETDEHKAVHTTLNKMAKLVTTVHSGEWLGFQGDKITDVVNIGIGGSDLGPRMVCKALTPYHVENINVHFVANVDGAELFDLQNTLNPATTLFLVASKSFSTQETLENALSARTWMKANGCSQENLAKHFVAISSKIDKAVEFGIAEENIYPIWDWVGGRYSLWSAIGLPIAMAVGMDNFNKLRQGAFAMDKHFAEAPLEKNIPVIMACLMFWYSECLGTSTQAILPYAYHLQLLPSYLQQLEMESNGKSVNLDGKRIDYASGSIVWGTEGTNGQHSFHQLLHQGTNLVPIDFIATLKGHNPIKHQQRLLFANCVAQSQALLTGRDLAASEKELRSQGFSEEEIAYIAPHKVHEGNKPSSTFVMETLTPETLGALIAAYEHKVFALAQMLNINPFDQWGVELGKLLGTHVNTALESTDIPGDWDSSTQQLIKWFCESNNEM